MSYFPKTKDDYTKEEMWARLEDDGIATYNELCLVTDIVGYTEQAMLDVLFARTGYRNFEQMEAEK